MVTANQTERGARERWGGADGWTPRGHADTAHKHKPWRESSTDTSAQNHPQGRTNVRRSARGTRNRRLPQTALGRWTLGTCKNAREIARDRLHDYRFVISDICLEAAATPTGERHGTDGLIGPGIGTRPSSGRGEQAPAMGFQRGQESARRDRRQGAVLVLRRRLHDLKCQSFILQPNHQQLNRRPSSC